jgi:hypothetical protein
VIGRHIALLLALGGPLFEANHCDHGPNDLREILSRKLEHADFSGSCKCRCTLLTLQQCQLAEIFALLEDHVQQVVDTVLVLLGYLNSATFHNVKSIAIFAFCNDVYTFLYGD